MRNPAEMFAAANFETSLLKRCCVLLERWQVALFFSYFPAMKFVPQLTAKSRKAIVHVNHHADSPGCKQPENVARAVELLSGAMAISDCVYADDKLEGVLQT